MEENNNEILNEEVINEEKVTNELSDNQLFYGIDRLTEKDIVSEVKSSFIEYSMSVIISRALPDLRDGLKPVHRRILWSMFESGYTPDKPHKKSARIVGDVMGKYHPHGDSSIYEAMVRQAQEWSYRHPLVDGHGNFGNIAGAGPAAMRYTESRLSKISLELLRDINKDTVNFIPNFDSSEEEPEILPSRFPNILVNGTMGIAVGMATNIPPHNLGEVIDGCIAYIDNPEITCSELMQYIKGPDFPTGGLILGNSGIRKAYETGRGSITIRSKASIEEKDGKHYIVIDEVPYGVNLTELKEKVADLVHNKIIDGISDYHQDLKNGIKITITLKKDANPQVVLNNLYKHTQFQLNYGIIFLMIDNGVPKTLALKDIISKYINYQEEVIIRRTRFDLDKAEKRVHILEGYKIALDNLDDFIKIIRESETDVIAKERLISKYGLSEAQADSILELKLRRLTGLERSKIEEEYQELLQKIKEYKEILASREKILEIIKTELLEIKDRYGDDRRTTIDMTAIDYIDDESLIPEQDVVITITNRNYIKRLTSDTYRIQNRGGVGIKGMATTDDDFVEQMINLSTHDYIMFFSNKGKVYRMKGYEIPEYSRTAKGLPIVNLLPLEREEKVKVILKVETESEYKNLVFATKMGLIKKTALTEFENIRQSGKIAISLKEDDELISVKKTMGTEQILMCSSNGRMVRFKESEIRTMGRTAAGVRGINLNNDLCVGMEVANDDSKVLVVTEKGYGKKTPIEDYRTTRRGSKGVKALNITDKNGQIVGFKSVADDCDVMIITNEGVVIRLDINSISLMGRVTQGVKLINIKSGKVASITIVPHLENEEVETNSESLDNGNESNEKEA